MRRYFNALLAVCLGAWPMNAFSDEGMWLLNEPPRELLQKRHAFTLTEDWLTRVRQASVRFNNGGSGSFVSPEGLIITNHHIGADALQKLSSPKRNYYHDGFYARTRAEELPCPDLELNVLESIEDVTARVNAAVKPDSSGEQAAAARRAILAEIEKEASDKTGLRCDVVTLYQGGAYHLYCYKKYKDVRLVMAPEHDIAFFGGDTDNFEFPRYNLDICFFRAYENNKPAVSPAYLKWSLTGPAEGDLVFVTGHPGTTNRGETLAKLLHRRDHSHPYTLARLRAFEAALLQFAERGPEERRIAATDIHRYANARKAFAGQYQGLLDSTVITRKSQDEKELREWAASQPAQAGNLAGWETVAEAQKKLQSLEREYNLLEIGTAFSCELFNIARHLVRLSTEQAVPNAQRLREYRLSNLDSLKFQLFSPAPITPELECLKLTTGLTFAAEVLGGDHPAVKLLLAGKSPANRAAELVAGSKLANVDLRKQLFEGGAKAIEESSDSMIALAKAIDPLARELRKKFEAEIEEPERQGFAKIAALRFARYGKTIAPDATFTLRLAFGVVKGYSAEGKDVPFQTTFGGLYARAESLGMREPFDLPPRWKTGKGRLDLSTPFNFVSTADTIGGNSGSPVLNRAGEFVGINFDRNRFGLVRNFVYTDVAARHISVHSRGIIEALRKLYDVEPLLNELGVGTSK